MSDDHHHDDDGAPGAPTARTGLLTRFHSIFRGRRRPDGSLRRSLEELMGESGEQAADGGEARPELDRQERALIENVLHLRGKTVDDVMVPRADIVAMPDDVDLDGALALVRREGHSRFPIFHEQLDQIVGTIHVKDLFTFVDRPGEFSLKSILREPLLVAPQVPVLDLLLQMRNLRTHLALVVDEYGGIDGLVSFEDLVETIVGDIADEHDEPEGAMMVERPDGTVDVDARMPIEEFEAAVRIPLRQDERLDDIDTVGGLVFNLAGRVPIRGEVISHPSGLAFRVIDADARHIRKVRASLPRTEAEEEASAGHGGGGTAPAPIEG